MLDDDEELCDFDGDRVEVAQNGCAWGCARERAEWGSSAVGAFAHRLPFPSFVAPLWPYYGRRGRPQGSL